MRRIFWAELSETPRWSDSLESSTLPLIIKQSSTWFPSPYPSEVSFYQELLRIHFSNVLLNFQKSPPFQHLPSSTHPSIPPSLSFRSLFLSTQHSNPPNWSRHFQSLIPFAKISQVLSSLSSSKVFSVKFIHPVGFFQVSPIILNNSVLWFSSSSSSSISFPLSWSSLRFASSFLAVLFVSCSCNHHDQTRFILSCNFFILLASSIPRRSDSIWFFVLLHPFFSPPVSTVLWLKDLKDSWELDIRRYQWLCDQV